MTPVEHLDLATVLKVSRALLGETDLQKLIATISSIGARTFRDDFDDRLNVFPIDVPPLR